MTEVTIEFPGHEPIHTTTEGIRRATERVKRDGVPSPEAPATRFAKDQLKAIIERIERLEEEKKGIGDDIKDVYSEAKSAGYDAKIMRQIVRLRKMKPDDRREMDMLLDTYKAALGIA